MASIGRHHHLDVDERLRVQTRNVYEGVLRGQLTSLQDNEAVGGAALDPETDVEIYTFDNEASIATFYVPAERVLTPEQHLHAIWLEFEVTDFDRATAHLADLGIEPLEYEDQIHPYFQAPGGQVSGWPGIDGRWYRTEAVARRTCDGELASGRPRRPPQ